MEPRADAGLESALLVAVPEAEPHVRRLRAGHDPSARLGIPGHITLLYPFVPPNELTTEVRRGLRHLFARVAPFDFSLADVRRFGDATLYLALSDETPFRDLIARVVRAFPDRPPYGGAFDDTVPHLTIADGLAPGEADRLLATAAVRRLPLPIAGHASDAWLMIRETDGWRVANRYRFGGDR
jgi:2'-5' RNA ligase